MTTFLLPLVFFALVFGAALIFARGQRGERLIPVPARVRVKTAPTDDRADDRPV